MKKETNGKKRFKVNAISFMKALKPKIRANADSARAPRGENNGTRSILRRINEKLNGFPGTV